MTHAHLCPLAGSQLPVSCRPSTRIAPAWRCSSCRPQPPCRSRQQICVHRAQCQRNIRCAAAAAPAAGAGRLLAASEISSFIPRHDLIDQMLRWAYIDGQDQGVANFGLPMTVQPTYREQDQLWGYTVTIHSREGEPLTQLSVRLDEEMTTKHDYVGRGADGFPAAEGASEEVLGKNLEIRKLDENPVDERLRSAIKAFCQGLVAAINKYYAFGSPFVDDAQ